MGGVTRWESMPGERGYGARFARLVADGADVDGEARLADVLAPRGARILDAGCGMGRVGAALRRRGHDAYGVDLDAALLEQWGLGTTVEGLRASVAKESRIWVEGYHDAELVAKVWGHDLAVEGIVVEPLHGIDDLPGAIASFGPGPQRRLGILVDHLVPGSKESKMAEHAMRVPGAPENVLILGHPYVDVWQAVKPAALGIPAWPVIPRGVDWKTGMARALGLPHRSPQDIGRAWQAILARVDTYADLEPALLGRVEELIDFLTAPGPAAPA